MLSSFRALSQASCRVLACVQKKGPGFVLRAGPAGTLVKVSRTSRQKKRIVLVAILECSSSEQPAFVGTPAAFSVGFTRSLERR